MRLAYVGSAMYGRLPVAIGAFRLSHPGVRLVLTEATTAAQVRGLRDGSLDMAVLIPPLADAGGLELRPFDRDRLEMALPAAHPLAGRATLADLAGEPFILWPERAGQGFHARAMRLCHEAGFRPRIVQEAHGMHAVLSLVAAGAGVALVPSRMARLHPETVAFRRIESDDAAFETMLAWPAGQLDPACRELAVAFA
ncbi:LysR family substrate-binding domain-containing protein [Roseomonas gilardii subsp. gilardii]|uniref:LysR family substrate-binding domain-containing protein n=1 Tax=Roseomonas gilardii TaxID=257708 RepID=UPI001FFAD653|nr:LysR family substrate-binding domain-containing protein [Roseomonas gilardii]UPG72151.1 LysR family substrate-binding domain-containing protein [Roseomonas gilardii subsp. gilardii]